MLIEEKYDEYRKKYDQFLKARESLVEEEEKSQKINFGKKQIKLNAQEEKNEKWNRLQDMIDIVETSIHYIETDTSYDEEEEIDDEIFEDNEDSFWNTDVGYINRSMNVDFLKTQLKELQQEKENFEINYERKLEQKLNSLDWKFNNLNNSQRVEELKQQLLDLKADIRPNAVSISEAAGRLKDYFYFPEGEIDCIGPINKIEHLKKPVIFLYDDKDSTIDEIYDFMDMIIQHIIELNPVNLLKLYINFYGIELSERQMYRRIREKTPIENVEYCNEIKELAEKINDDIDYNFQKCKKSNIDMYNENICKMYGESSKEYLRWSILQMFIPQSFDDMGQKMNINILDIMEDSCYGYIPFFYISEENWNDEKTENATVKSLKEKMLKKDEEGEEYFCTIYHINISGKKFRDYVPGKLDDFDETDLLF